VQTAASIRKFIAAIVGTALTAVSLGLIPEDQSKYVATAVSFLAALGVYVVKNDQ
jgi:hypothetical protein